MQYQLCGIHEQTAVSRAEAKSSTQRWWPQKWKEKLSDDFDARLPVQVQPWSHIHCYSGVVQRKWWMDVIQISDQEAGDSLSHNQIALSIMYSHLQWELKVNDVLIGLLTDGDR